MEALTTQVAFGKKVSGSEGVRYIDTWEKNVPGQGKSKYKCPVAGMNLAFKERLDRCCLSRARRERMAGEEIKGSRSQITRALVDHDQQLAECSGDPGKVLKTTDIVEFKNSFWFLV